MIAAGLLLFIAFQRGQIGLRRVGRQRTGSGRGDESRQTNRALRRSDDARLVLRARFALAIGRRTLIAEPTVVAVIEALALLVAVVVGPLVARRAIRPVLTPLLPVLLPLLPLLTAAP